MGTAGRGPAYEFWLAIQRATDRLGMSIRELDERSGVRRMAIARLRDTPHRSRSARRRTVLDLANALNEVAKERDSSGWLPFPDEHAVLVMAGLASPEPDQTVSVRESVERSTEYDPVQKQALFSLLDVLDQQRGRDRRDDTA